MVVIESRWQECSLGFITYDDGGRSELIVVVARAMILAAACIQRTMTLHVLVLQFPVLRGNYEVTLVHAASLYCVLSPDTSATVYGTRELSNKLVVGDV
jgi:hypothetical protein